MTSKLIQAIGFGFAASTVGVLAGDDFSSDPVSSIGLTSLIGGGIGDWAENLSIKNIGTVYKDKSNPIIQEVKFGGRYHHQWGYTDGDISNGPANSGSFSGSTQEIRRLRAGASIKFLNGFKAVGSANFESGSANNNSIQYDGWDVLYLEYGFGDIAGLEDVTIGYGRYKFGFGGEETSSSKKIKTIERSLLNNYFAGDRVTGVRLEASHNKTDYTFGVFNTDGDDETFGSWNGGVVLQFGAEFKALGGEFNIQGVYRDSTDNVADETIAYDWAVSTTYERELGPFDLFVNGTYGSDDNGEVYGVVVMPSIDLIEDKLEAVVRYQWAHSTGNSLRVQSRNTRNVLSADGFNDPRGNDHHSIYGGLNYFISGHNAKLMVGIEYEDLDGDTGGIEATTLWGAVRVFF